MKTEKNESRSSDRVAFWLRLVFVLSVCVNTVVVLFGSADLSLVVPMIVERSSSRPSASPTATPTGTPTAVPTTPPTMSPSLNPTLYPSLQPSLQPSFPPSLPPSMSPSLYPSLHPSFSQPTKAPTSAPTHWTIPPWKKKRIHDKHMRLMKNERTLFSESDLRKAWDAVENQVDWREQYCIPEQNNDEHPSQRPPSMMECVARFERHRGGFLYLCSIRNLYAEITPHTGKLVMRMLNCVDPRNQSSNGIVRLESSRLEYKYFEIELGLGNHSFEDVTLRESLAMSVYKIHKNPWHALADLSAHWMSLRILSDLIHDPSLFDPRWNFTLVRSNGTFTNQSSMFQLYDGYLWDSVVIGQTKDDYITQRAGWNASKTGAMLVRIPHVILPFQHWFGLQWRRPENPKPDPVYFEWLDVTHGWMMELVRKNGPRLVQEMCVEKAFRFRMFGMRVNQTHERVPSLNQGWLNERECRQFWAMQQPLLFFGDRRVDGMHSREPCATKRCIRNVNDFREAILSGLGSVFSILMGNPAVLSLQSQFELFQRTDVLFGMHGAMFAVAQFMRERTLVFEIHPRKNEMAEWMMRSQNKFYRSYECSDCSEKTQGNRIRARRVRKAFWKAIREWIIS